MKDNDSLKEQLEERKAFHKRRSTKEGRATKARRKKCQVCGKWMFNVPTGKAYCSSSCKSKAANTRALAKKHEEHFSRDISELTFKEMEKVLMANGIRRGTYKQALARYANVESTESACAFLTHIQHHILCSDTCSESTCHKPSSPR